MKFVETLQNNRHRQDPLNELIELNKELEGGGPGQEYNTEPGRARYIRLRIYRLKQRINNPTLRQRVAGVVRGKLPEELRVKLDREIEFENMKSLLT